MYDVLIIGAGAVGCAIARELSRYKLNVALLEREPDVAMWGSKANSAIVHGGYAESHSKLKGRLCYKGRRQFAKLDGELHFGFKPIGSHVLAFDEAQKPELEALLENGRLNGLEDLSILNRDEILGMEPNINPEVKYSLYCAGAGVCSPFEYTIALAENAVHNGVKLFLNTEVTGVSQKPDGGIELSTASGKSFAGRYVVNAGGIDSGTLAALAGEADFTVHPRSGEFILFNQGTGSLVNAVLFQMPTKMGKGILVTPTVYGNLLIGPDAIDERVNDRNTHAERLYSILQVAKMTTDKLDITKFLRSFAGVRAVASTDDFVVGGSQMPGFLNVAGIQSPGLTSSPAIAEMVRDMLADQGLALEPNSIFDPNRRATYVEREFLPADELKQYVEKEEGDHQRITCRDEQVFERDILEALKGGIPVRTPDAVKRRTRAGMGFCQGAFCRSRVVSLLEKQGIGEIDPRPDTERAGLSRVTRQQMLEYVKKTEN